MAIERHGGYEPAVDSGAARTEGGDRLAWPLGERSTGDRPIPEERRSRSELHAALRATDTGADSVPHPANRDAPRTTPDGAWEWKGLRLASDTNRIADRELSARRSAEGRGDDGRYGDRGITPAMRRVEAKLDHGALVPDTERLALKTPARFKEKLAKMIAIEPGRPPSELSKEIHDGIRYTLLFSAEHYSAGVDDACHQITTSGYSLTGFKPSWSGDEYKGINSQWKDPTSGQLFEVQFHTSDSWAAKQATHDAYERIASPETSPAERSRLREYQREVSARIPIPPRALDFFPYKPKEG
jgi:hypothetical protein